MYKLICVHVFRLALFIYFTLISYYALADDSVDFYRKGRNGQLFETSEGACHDYAFHIGEQKVCSVSGSYCRLDDVYSDCSNPRVYVLGRAYEEYVPVINLNNDMPNECVGNPVDPVDGSKLHIENVMKINGVKPISFNLFYDGNSIEKWRMSFSRVLRHVNANDFPRIDFSSYEFGQNPYAVPESDGGMGYYPSTSYGLDTPSIYGVNSYRTRERACLIGWEEAVQSAGYGYDMIDTLSAEYIEGGICNIYDSNGEMRLRVGIYKYYSGTPAYVDSDEFIRMVRDSGRVIIFKLVSGHWINKSGTGETLESILDSQIEAGFRFTSKNDEVEIYDATGRIVSITSKSGFVQIITYDPLSGLPEKILNETGEFIQLAYERYGSSQRHYRISSLSDHLGRSWFFRYDQNYNLEYIDFPDGVTKQYHYESELFINYLTGITDENGNRYSTWQYNSDGQVILSAHGDDLDKDRVELSYFGDESRTVAKVRASPINDSEDVFEYEYTVKRTSSGSPIISSITGPDCFDCVSSSIEYEYNSLSGDLIYKIDHFERTDYGDYDEKKNPGSILEAAGSTEERHKSLTYDSRYQSSVKTVTESSVYSAGEKTTSYTYDDYGNIVTYRIDGFNKQGGAVSREYMMEYNSPFNQISKYDGPREDVSDITYFTFYPDDPEQVNNRSRLRSVRTHSGWYLRNNIQYSSTGKVLSESRLNGLQIEYNYYAGNDRLEAIRMTDTSSGVVRAVGYAYMPTGEIKSITYAYGSDNPVRLSFDYDDGRRLTKVVDGHGNYIEYVLDTEGNIREENVYDNSGSIKKSLSQTFDSYNRLKTSIQVNENRTVNFNPDGTVGSVVDGNGVLTEYGYDSLKRLVTMTQDTGGQNPYTANTITQYIYDSQDNLTTVIAANNAETRYVYDDLGNLTSLVSPDTGTVRYEHDAAGNIIGMVDAKNQVFSYTYDAFNRLQQIMGPDLRDDVYYTYDNCAQGQGLVCSIQRGNSTLNYKYNAFSDVTEISQSLITVDGFNAAENTVAYAYTTNGDISSITYPSGAVVNYSYNRAGRVDNVYLDQDGTNQSLSLNITYMPFGAESIQVYGNGISVMGLYDAAYRPFIIGDPDHFFEYISVYDGNANITELTSLFNDEYVHSQFEYDRLNRISSASGFHGGSGYFYDKIGNKQLQAESGYFFAASYDTQSNRLNSLGGEEIAVDENGNLLNLRGMALSYTSDNRLQSVNSDARFEYNGLGQRVMKRSAAPDVAGSYGYVQTTSYIYGKDAQLLAEVGPTGRVIKEYVYLNETPLAMLVHTPSNDEGVMKSDLDSDGEISAEDAFIWYFNHRTDPAHDVTGDGVTDSQDISMVLTCGLSQTVCAAESYSTEIYYIHNDHLGTPKLLTDSHQQAVWRARSTPFGKAFVNNDVDGDGVEVEFNLRQPGQYYDKDSRLYYNYYRYYDPETGRYITSDPLGVLPGVSPTPNLPKAITNQYASQTTQEKVKNGLNHTYAYVENNPLGSIDPLGLRPTKNPKGPDGRPRSSSCATKCVTNFAGQSLLAGALGYGVGAYVMRVSISASRTGHLSWGEQMAGWGASTINTLNSNFDVATCLSSCNEPDSPSSCDSQN